jgi:hypothetical protein
MSVWEAHRSLGTPPVKSGNTRLCPNCTRPMAALFYSLSCNHCESPPKGLFYVGYVALRTGREKDSFQYYVWYSRISAEAWASQLHEANEVRAVLTQIPFTWTAAPNGVAADNTYRVMPDHRFELRPYHVFLAPKTLALASDRVFL